MLPKCPFSRSMRVCMYVYVYCATDSLPYYRQQPPKQHINCRCACPTQPVDFSLDYPQFSQVLSKRWYSFCSANDGTRHSTGSRNQHAGMQAICGHHKRLAPEVTDSCLPRSVMRLSKYKLMYILAYYNCIVRRHTYICTYMVNIV